MHHFEGLSNAYNLNIVWSKTDRLGGRGVGNSGEKAHFSAFGQPLAVRSQVMIM